MADVLIPPDPQILNYNLTRVLKMPALKLPASYLVIDTETTGFSHADDYIWQVGMYPVTDGVPECDYSQGKCAYWLKLDSDKLRKAKFEISRRRALALGVPLDRDSLDELCKSPDKAWKAAEDEFIAEVQTKGEDPATVLDTVHNLVKTFVTELRAPIVGQNCVKFDIPFLEFKWTQYGMPLKFPDETIFDTGMLIKAAVIKKCIGPTETNRAFFARIGREYAKGVYYALERFCMPYWHLPERYNLDVSKAHDAGFDAYVTSLVLRELINESLRTP